MKHMDNCIFCKIVQQKAPSWKVMETEDVYAFLDINPVNAYHTLIIPKAHYVNMFDTPASVLQSMMGVIKEITTLYQEKVGINNLQVVCSSGAEAQQDVFHIHYHIVPRRLGDGQNIRWKPKPEMRSEFDDLLAKLK